MKTLFLIFGLFLTFDSKAQGNLQFNRVVFIEADTTVSVVSGTPEPTNVLVRTIVVPNGKVLKIESINCGGCGYYSTYGYAIYLDSLPLLPTPYFTNNSPIWLPAGNYTIKYYSTNTATQTVTLSLAYHFSAIEFNIVP
jgi:hypothetical protein